MRDIETARGLITFLFAVGTIGIFVVVTSATFVGNLQEADVRFTRGKDTLSMLIGIFGTILGFYFGSTTTGGAPEEATDEPEVVLESLLIQPEHPAAGTRAKIAWMVDGGTAPYHYFIDFDPPPGVMMDDSEVLLTTDTGFMYHEFELPDHSGAFSLEYQIVVIDAEARSDRVVKGTIAVASPVEAATSAPATGTSPHQVTATR